MKKILVSLLVIGALILSCSKDNESKASSGFDRKALTTSLANNIIDHNLTTLVTKSEGFNACVETLKSSGAEADFEALKACWKDVAEHWQLSRFFMVKDLKYSTQEQALAYWPINQTKVDANVNLSTPITQTWVAGIGSNQKGIYTLERLIFSYTWADVTANSNILNYISAIAKENIKAAKLLNSTWTDTYKAKFIENTDNFVTSTVPILTNRIIEYSEFAKNEKLGFALGLVKYTDVDPDKLESIYAQYSMELMLKNLDVVENVYLGGNQETMIGYDDYLLSFGQQGKALDTKIKAQMSKLKTQLTTVPKPAYTNLTTGSVAYTQLYEDWKALIKLFKTEFITILDVTPTFSDGDGD